MAQSRTGRGRAIVTEERWGRVKALFQAAVDRPIEERGAFLAAATGDDSGLRGEVESLLAADTSDATFLGRLPIADQMIRAGQGGAGSSAAPAFEAAMKAMTEDAAPSMIGRQLGSCRVKSLLGAGGMGEVYRAHDTKLNRDVALKILPAAFARDTDRLARFTREARAVAALNHPHIGAIYGFEDSGDTHALVLEFVDGPTLANRIAQGLIPIDEAL